MGAPHNPDRYGEVYDQKRLDVMQLELEAIKDLVVVSGGWAWHFLSPPHTEYKHLHDHKDLDLFVAPQDRATLAVELKGRGYRRVGTRFDHLPSEVDFVRYEKHVAGVKVVIDLFVKGVAYGTIGGFRVIDPMQLLLQYKEGRHDSTRCVAVTAARKLVKEGKEIHRNPTLIRPPWRS